MKNGVRSRVASVRPSTRQLEIERRDRRERVKNFDRLFACNFGPFCVQRVHVFAVRGILLLLCSPLRLLFATMSARSLPATLTAAVEIIISMCFLLPPHVMPFFIRSTHVYRSASSHLFIPFLLSLSLGFWFRPSALITFAHSSHAINTHNFEAHSTATAKFFSSLLPNCTLVDESVGHEFSVNCGSTQNALGFV